MLELPILLAVSGEREARGAVSKMGLLVCWGWKTGLVFGEDMLLMNTESSAGRPARGAKLFEMFRL